MLFRGLEVPVAPAQEKNTQRQPSGAVRECIQDVILLKVIPTIWDAYRGDQPKTGPDEGQWKRETNNRRA